MSRRARKKSTTGIYHVMVRGINRQEIFEEADDCRFFLNLLKNVKDEADFELYAFCLMGNHIHLLVAEKQNGEKISRFMGKLESDYAMWFNHKYQRVGYLFQDRFKTEPVESVRYFQVVFRYIHQNPVKAGIVKSMEEYPWSSWQDYTRPELSNRQKIHLVDREIPRLFFESDSWLLEFGTAGNEDECMDMDLSYKKMADTTAKTIMRWVTGCGSAAEFQRLERRKKEQLLEELIRENLTGKQICRLCGVSSRTVAKIRKKAEGTEKTE